MKDRYFLYKLQSIEIDIMLRAVSPFAPEEVKDLIHYIKDAAYSLSEANVEKANEYNEKAYQTLDKIGKSQGNTLLALDELKEFLLLNFMTEMVERFVKKAIEK